MKQVRSWYKKKRFLIPAGLVGLATALSISNANPQPQVQSLTQTVQQTQNQQRVHPETPQAANITPAPIRQESAPNGYYENSFDDEVAKPYQAPSKPAGVTAQCRDGSYSSSQHRQGTCSHHGGVATWY